MFCWPGLTVSGLMDLLVRPVMLLKLLLLVSLPLLSSTVLVVSLVLPSSDPVGMSRKQSDILFTIYIYYKKFGLCSAIEELNMFDVIFGSSLVRGTNSGVVLKGN